MAEKIYAKGIWVKTRTTDFGDVLKLSIKVADFGAFVKENKNEAGYINLDVVPRKNESDKGETHYVSLDTWKPDASKKQSEGGEKQKKAAPKKEAAAAEGFGDEEDIPFA